MFRQLCHLPLLLLLLWAPNWLRARQFPAQVTHTDVASNNWQAYVPGQLLQKLDTLTDAAVAGEPKNVTNTSTSRERSPLPAHRKSDMDDNYDDAPATSLNNANDNGNSYERTYEQFVRQYFDRADEDQSLDSISAHSASAESHELDTTDDGSALHEEDIDGDYDYEPTAKASNVKAKHSKKTKPGGKSRTRCKHVRRNKEQCKICRDARNNGISETCSYSHEATPQQFAYGAARQYKRYKQDPDGNDDDSDDDYHEDDGDAGDDDDDDTAANKDEPQSAETTNKHTKNSSANDKPKTKSAKKVRTYTHGHAANVTKMPHGTPNSFCVRRLQAKKVCYDCKDNTTGAPPLTRCYAVRHKPKARKTQQRRHNAEQRIYKRTVSYATYTQASTNDTEPVMTATTTSTTTSRTPITPITPTTTTTTTRKVIIPQKRSSRLAGDQPIQTFRNGPSLPTPRLSTSTPPTTTIATTKPNVASFVNNHHATKTTMATTTTTKTPTLPSETDVRRVDHSDSSGRNRTTLLKIVRRKRLN